MYIGAQTRSELARDPGAAARALIALWQSKCRDGKIPGRADFDVGELKDWLGHLAIYAVEQGADGPRFRFRLAGTMIVEYDGGDYTGRYLDEAIPAAYHRLFLPAYREVVRSRRPFLQTANAPNARGVEVRFTKVLLPLASDGLTVDMVMLFMFAQFPEHGRPANTYFLD